MRWTMLMMIWMTIHLNGLFAAEQPLRYLSIENGLSNNAVVNVYQDYKGFMWFGTYDGLNRYDGYKFRIYRNRIGDTTSLIDNGIYTIDGDTDHRLWIGGRKGVSIFDPVNERFCVARNVATGKAVEGNIHVIKAGNDGTVLVGSETKGLLLFNRHSAAGRQIPINNNTNYEVTAIEFNADKTVAYIFVQDIGLCKYDCRKATITIISNELKQANCLKSDRNGDLWIGTDKGLFRYNNSYSANYLKENSKIVSLCADNQGLLWAASDGHGIFIVRDGKAERSNYPLSSNAVYSICEDREGRKWIGTLRGGVNIIDNRRNLFEQHAFKGTVDNFILSFCEADGRNMWIGTDGGGLKYWDRENNIVKNYNYDRENKHAISSNFITGMLKDSNGDLWIATWFGGVSRYNKSRDAFDRYTCFNPFTQAAENNVWVIYEDAQKNLWASTSNNGTLYLFNRQTNTFELFDRTLVNLQCLAEDRQGNMWGGNYSSLIKIDRDHKQHRTYRIGYTVRTVHEDRRGILWVGTEGGGLLEFNPASGKYKRFSEADGLPGNSVLRLLEDDKGNLWLSTFNGLAKFDPITHTCRSFSQTDGLQSNQFAYNAALKLKSGEFFFGGIKGFNIFHPDSIYERSNFSPVFLTGIRLNNVPAEQNNDYISKRSLENIQEITVPYDKAAVSLDFVALEYTSPDKIGYSYLLEGWDKGWNDARESRTANYTHLQEGDYNFMLRVTNADGKWGEEMELLKIIVLPPWYRTGWAYGIYIALIFGVIYLFIQYKSRQERLRYEIRLAHLESEKEKEMNEKKLSFFTNISHEFRTPLTLIINPLKELKDSEKLGVVYRNARRLLSLVDQLLLFRKADNEELTVTRFDIIALCNEVFLCFTQQAETRNIRYHFRTDNDESIEIYANYEQIEIALFNLLSNAFKFTPDGGEISFCIQQTAGGVDIELQDSGPGIPENMGDKIFDKFQHGDNHSSGFGIGLYLVRKFVENHKGKVSYSSRINEGTTFCVHLKRGKEHFDANILKEEPVKKSAILDELIDDVYRKPEKPLSPGEMITEKRSILVIDDNAEIRDYLRQLFADKYIIYDADNGTDGFAAVEKYMPDLVISDVHMEGMNGIELCRKIKETDIVSHIPVILLTSASSSEARMEGIGGGADDYITKPFDSALLLVKVQTIIRNRNLLQQYYQESITLKTSYVKVPAEYQDFLKRCIEIVEANLGNEDFSIKTFTQAIGMSHSSLYKKVKSISGQTINAFIRSIRLRKAAVLMLKENYTVNQAAFQVGIADNKYFREQFCKLFGMNPSAYVKKYRHSFNQDLNVVKSDTSAL
ncbi:hybrid sensor histidine kinase/response regulator transcription factor [Chitinophaga sp. S165]|uniref:hybrid sensor histidine kinase/response regulator transcription factor n=1 Tax=Chitinophaga sp. S165 TaxID=2135462 RepID=UPI000D70C990|nr:hybrid sensor histidine kinase/response regulator transcription factor [Chitinophaga sp. S165]PWV56310.1 signal transduction histidine kinase [Chitinophaga sp. S165]